MLDTVRPVATLPLVADADVPGLLTLASEYAVTLADGSAAVVRCARTAANRHVLDVGQGGQPAVHVEADAPISALLRLRMESSTSSPCARRPDASSGRRRR